MAINATNEGNNFFLVEAGTYAARCYSMIHIGTIPVEFQNEIKQQNKVRITWELPTELREFKEGEGEKPIAISKEFTLSMHEKSTLRHFLESWRGKGFTEQEAKCFDITKLLGKECMLSIIHKQKPASVNNYAVISSVSTLPKGMTVPAQINPSFEFSYDNFDEDKFSKLPDFIKDKMKQSVEYKKIANPQEAEIPDNSNINPNTDDLPF